MSKVYKRSGSSYYWWTAYYHGKRLRQSTKMTQKSLAKKVASHFDVSLFKNDLSFLSAHKTSGADIGQYIVNYIQFLEKRKSSNTIAIAKGVLRRFQQFIQDIEVKYIEQITSRHLNQYIDCLDRAPKTKKNHIGIISLMLKQANIDGLLTKDPTKFVTLPKMKKSIRHRELELDDLNIIFENAGKWKRYYMFLLYTGLRAGDVSMLTYGNINIDNGMITTLIQKSKQTYQIPIADILVQQMSYWGEHDEPLFPTLYAEKYRKRNDLMAQPRKYLQKILLEHGREKATLHSFRVTFNCLLRNNGLRIEDRQKLLAHSSSETTKIYTHPNPQLARKHINQIPHDFKGFENVTKM